MGQINDDQGSDSYDWDSDDKEKEPEPTGGGAVSSRPVAGWEREAIASSSVEVMIVSGQEQEAIARSAGEASEAGPSCLNLKNHFLEMGFSKDMVVKALEENREGDMDGVLETLLAYGAIENSPSNHELSPINYSSESEKDDMEDDLSYLSDFDSEMPTNGPFDKDRIISKLLDMGFLAEEASSAIDRCGMDASVLELADSIYAAQVGEGFSSPQRNYAEDVSCAYRFQGEQMRKRRRVEERKIKRNVDIHRNNNAKKKENMKKFMMDDDADDDDCTPSQLFSIPVEMIGFGLPFQRPHVTHRNLPEAAIGPPYFYYENVAKAPPGVWETISRFLYDIEPEFVDSKYFSACNRKRGYIHNLPINNRFPIQPIPPKTIQEALPQTKKWWPSWDPRTHFNCLQTCIASAKNTERIRLAIAESEDPPPLNVQKYVLFECRKWNLVWVGKHKLAPLEPDEYEILLGFPRDHTRGCISRTDRYKSLGNSFQLDTVAYHLSVLKNMYPNGMNVLSLFSGIGGAEVALHRLGIKLNTVVSVELSEVNRNTVRGWWEQTNQTGMLIDFADVRELDAERLRRIISKHGGFDLVIGGSPCNNLAGSNRHTRNGLEGEHSSLFYDYFRILDIVKRIMGSN